MIQIKYLVLGSNGMAGHMIAIYLMEKGHQVQGFARAGSAYIPTVIGDAKNIDMLREIINKNNYDAVINCIGILNKKAEEDKENSVFLNAYLPHYLAKITKTSQTQIIHISTDCVFSGKKGNYKVDDFRDGESFYDRTKALGEIDDNKNLTLRSSIIGPDLNPEGIGLFNWFMKQKNQIKGFNKAMWTGQTTLQLAKTIEVLSKNRVTGIYNSVPSKNISKFHLLNLLNQQFKNNKILIVRDDDVVIDKSLIPSKFCIDYFIPDYIDMIEELKVWINQHKNLYPHYIDSDSHQPRM